ncbi:hypothetical protein [Ferrimonas aestuarii]|uniref:Uncharacterized protein n=1 Tax=Ferrimonas aestuarii TaxID=2569539 RepID=A0A4U1BS31_9GAMM|nr:hypothetical protein [Ferrimonas aestuarii]TKB57396.1 hypothetical protein FCL42_03735 [Ferrimonas aestuarii]
MFSEIEQFNKRTSSLRGSSGSCVKSALYHVEMAKKLACLDPEMSIFRLITAEEEAATAIILMLKEHGYDGSKRLSKNNHLHKQCLHTYICSVWDAIKGDLHLMIPEMPEMRWTEVDGQHAIKLMFKINIDGQSFVAEPSSPMNFQVSNNEEPHDFSGEIFSFLEEKGFSDTVKHLKENANLRNKLLYSDGNKIPNSLSDTSNGKYDKLARYLLSKTNALIAMYYMTAPYKKANKAHFLQQSLDGYLKVLDHVKGRKL